MKQGVAKVKEESSKDSVTLLVHCKKMCQKSTTNLSAENYRCAERDL